MGAIVFDRKRIDDSASREDEALLAGKPRDRLDQAKRLRMRAARQEACIEQGRRVVRLNRSVPDAAGGRFDFDQWLQKVEAARAGAHDFDLDAASRALRPEAPARPLPRRPRAPRNRGERRAGSSLRPRILASDDGVQLVTIDPSDRLPIQHGGRARARNVRGSRRFRPRDGRDARRRRR